MSFGMCFKLAYLFNTYIYIHIYTYIFIYIYIPLAPQSHGLFPRPRGRPRAPQGTMVAPRTGPGPVAAAVAWWTAPGPTAQPDREYMIPNI